MNFLEILSANTTAGQLELHFSNLGDRYGQQLLWKDPEGEPHILLESGDQTQDANWPTSPPLQQISAEPRDNATVMLGVGMFDRHHWSLSVLGNAESCVFEAACRPKFTDDVQTSQFPFESSYRVLTDGQISPLEKTESGNSLEISWPGIGTLCWNSPERVRVTEDLVCVGTTLAEGAETVAWEYTWNWRS